MDTHSSESLLSSTSATSTSSTVAAGVSSTTLVGACAAGLGPPFFFDFFLLGMLADVDGVGDRRDVVYYSIQILLRVGSRGIVTYDMQQCMIAPAIMS